MRGVILLAVVVLLLWILAVALWWWPVELAACGHGLIKSCPTSLRAGVSMNRFNSWPHVPGAGTRAGGGNHGAGRDIRKKRNAFAGNAIGVSATSSGSRSDATIAGSVRMRR